MSHTHTHTHMNTLLSSSPSLLTRRHAAGTMEFLGFFTVEDQLLSEASLGSKERKGDG